MSRALMPKSGALAPYVVINRDAAVAGVFSVDGQRGSVDLTSKYVLVSNYESDKADIDNRLNATDSSISNINTSIGNINTTISTKAAKGANTDITSLSGLTTALSIEQGGTGAKTPRDALVKLMNGSPLTLLADAVNAYDAVTLRQLQASSGGSGASMNGVMNNFIGAVEWFNGTRAALPAGYVPADGQLLSRTAYPDLWAAVDTGVFNSVEDSVWINSGDAGRPTAWRSSFSKGDGSSTFRVPDLNGTGANSIKHLFLSGSSGAPSEPSAGQVWVQSSPNILATINTVGAGAFQPGVGTAGNAFATSTAAYSGISPNQFPSSAANVLAFSARDSNRTYGRGTQYQRSTGETAIVGDVNNIGDLFPNHAVGIWIIRASGAFKAANTEFNVINSDSTDPSTGTTVHGGVLKSRYNVAGKTRLAAGSYANFPWGSIAGEASHNIDIIAYNDDGSVASNATYVFQANGVIRGGLTRIEGTGAQLMSWPETGGMRPGVYSVPFVNVGSNFGWAPVVTQSLASSNGYQTTLHLGQIFNDATSFAEVGLHAAGDSNAQFISRLSIAPNREDVFFFVKTPSVPNGNAYTLTKAPASDNRLKHDIKDTDGTQSLANIEAMRFRTFVFNNDEQNRMRRGLIAQELEEVDPLYVKTRTYYPEPEQPREQKELDNNALLLDALAAIQVLSKKINSMEQEIAEMKSKTENGNSSD